MQIQIALIRFKQISTRHLPCAGDSYAWMYAGNELYPIFQRPDDSLI